jgi:hypothetical protein
MAYALSVGGQTFNLLNPNDLGFAHTSFTALPRSNRGREGQIIATAPTVQVTSTSPRKLNKCPSTKSQNGPNDCGEVKTIFTLISSYNAQATNRANVLTEIQRLSDADSFTYAIDGVTQLENYFYQMAQVFAEREAYARYLRQYSWGTKDKWRCCYRNRELDDGRDYAHTKKNDAWQDFNTCRTLAKRIKELQSAVNDSTISELEVEKFRATANYQIAQTNQQIAKEGYISSQLALKEGSGKIVMVVMALVAAFFVYRFLIKR